MNLIISMYSDMPIYKQIKDQIKKAIFQKKINSQDKLPSIRALSKELQVGIITVKRAYDDLVKEGFIVSKASKGYFVLPVDIDKFHRIYINKIESLINEIQRLKEEANLDISIVNKLWENKGDEKSWVVLN